MHPVTEAADILQILDIERKKLAIPYKESPLKGGVVDKTEKKILELLDSQTKHIDAIVRESGLKIDKVSTALSMM